MTFPLFSRERMTQEGQRTKRQKVLIERVLKKLTKPQARVMFELGMMLGANDGMGLKLLQELDKP